MGFPSPATDRIGTVVNGRYRVTHFIGEGGMGVVYAAQHAELGFPVAIKFLHAEAARDADQLARFFDEAKATSALRHPNIVAVQDLDLTHDGDAYMVLDLLEGESLADRLGEGLLSPEKMVDVLVPTLDALHAVHQAGIIHRDLKPENLFLTRIGDKMVPKILDFGVAKLFGAELARTRTGMVVGTPMYMAPEQAQAKGIGPWTDIWAMGIVAYEALTGNFPIEFDEEATAPALLAKVIVEDPIPIEMRNPNLPPALCSVINRALVKNTSERWPDAKSFADALEHALGPSFGKVGTHWDGDLLLERSRTFLPAGVPTRMRSSEVEVPRSSSDRGVGDRGVGERRHGGAVVPPHADPTRGGRPVPAFNDASQPGRPVPAFNDASHPGRGMSPATLAELAPTSVEMRVPVETVPSMMTPTGRPRWTLVRAAVGAVGLGILLLGAMFIGANIGGPSTSPTEPATPTLTSATAAPTTPLTMAPSEIEAPSAMGTPMMAVGAGSAVPAVPVVEPHESDSPDSEAASDTEAGADENEGGAEANESGTGPEAEAGSAPTPTPTPTMRRRRRRRPAAMTTEMVSPPAADTRSPMTTRMGRTRMTTSSTMSGSSISVQDFGL